MKKIQALMLSVIIFFCSITSFGNLVYASSQITYLYYGSFFNIDNVIDYFDTSVTSDESFVDSLFVSESSSSDTTKKELIDINTIIPGNTSLSFSSSEMKQYVAYFLVPVNKVSNFDLSMGDSIGLALFYLDKSGKFDSYSPSSDSMTPKLFSYDGNDYMCLRTNNLAGASFGGTFYFKNLETASASPKGLTMVDNSLSGIPKETKKIIELSGDDYANDYIYYGSIYNSNQNILDDFENITENNIETLFVDEDNYFGCGNYSRISITDMVSHNKNYSFSIDKSMYYVNYFLIPINLVDGFSTSHYLRLLYTDNTFDTYSSTYLKDKAKLIEHDGNTYICVVQKNYNNFAYGKMSFTIIPKDGTTIGYIDDADYANDTITTNIHMVKSDLPASAYVALYDNDTLLDVSKTDISTVSSRFQVPIKYKFADNKEYKLKLMLFNDNFMPLSLADTKEVTSDTVDYLYYGTFSGIDNVVSYFDNAITSDEEFIKELFVAGNTTTETSEKNRVDITTLVSGSTRWTFSQPGLAECVAYFLIPVNKISEFVLVGDLGLKLILNYLNSTTNAFSSYKATSTTMTPKLFSYAGNNYMCLRSTNLGGAETAVTVSFKNIDS